MYRPCGKIWVREKPQDYDQKRKLFRTNSFVLAHSSAKKIYGQREPVLWHILHIERSGTRR